MTLTLASGASVTDLTVADDTGDGTAIAKVYSPLLLSVCTVPDSGPQEFGGLGAFPCRNGGMTSSTCRSVPLMEKHRNGSGGVVELAIL